MVDRPEQAQERLLVLRCQAGDQSAYTDLYRRYHAPLLYYLRRMLPSPELSEDLLQNVWIKTLRGILSLRDPGSFRTWIYRIAHNEALMWFRKQGRTLELESLDSLEAGMEAGDVPILGDEEADDAGTIHAALGDLKPLHREILVLRFLEDLSYEEIAAVTGISVGTVRSRLYYAKLTLRKVMEDRRLCKTRT